MTDSLKQIIAVVVVIGILAVAYIGNYLPLQKSESYINALKNMSNYRSLSDFEGAFSTALDSQSPVGQEELVRDTTRTVLNLLQGSKQQKAVVEELVRYSESYFAPIIQSDKGMSFGQDIYMLGAINAVAYRQTGESKYLSAADSYFSKGLTLSSDRPQYLYGLFDVYRMEGNVAGAKAIADKILSLWPSDTDTKQLLDEFSAKNSAQ